MFGMMNGAGDDGPGGPADEGGGTLAIPGTRSDLTRMPAVRLRTFDGNRDPEVHRTWRREVDLIQLFTDCLQNRSALWFILAWSLAMASLVAC